MVPLINHIGFVIRKYIITVYEALYGLCYLPFPEEHANKQLILFNLFILQLHFHNKCHRCSEGEK